MRKKLNRLFLKSLLLVILLTGVSLFAACGRVQQNEAPDVEATLEMTIEPDQPVVGPARLIFTLTDQAGQPINDAVLEIEGNMTHAGMVPVLAQAAEGQDGRYVVPFEWTMGGDWIVTIETTLADGQTFSRQFPVTVQ